MGCHNRLSRSIWQLILPILLWHGSPLACQAAETPQVAAGVGPHPRLFFDNRDIPQLRSMAATSHSEIWNPILEYASSKLGTVPGKTPKNDTLRAYRSNGNQMIPMAFACVVTDDEGICETARRHLLSYANWQQWDVKGRRDLGHAHMLMGNALAYDWIYDKLNEDDRGVIRQNLGRWAQRMYEASLGPKHQEWRNWWHKSLIQNHFWTNNSALGITGLSLLDEDPRAQSWIDQARDQITRVQYILNGIEDGSWHEGITYQNYGLTLLLPFLVNLRRIQGTDIFPHDYLQNYPQWRLYNYIPDSTDFILSYGNVNETRNSKRPQNILRFIAREYRNGHAEWMAQQLIRADGRHLGPYSTPWYVFEFLYYDPSILAKTPDDLPLTRTFPDSEAVVWRTGWRQGDLIFGLKTGPYGGRFAFDSFVKQSYPWMPPCPLTDCKFNFRHGHDDANNFYLYGGGQWLVPEAAGVGDNDTAFHNCILVDGKGQYRPKDSEQRDPQKFAGTDGFLEATAHTPGFDYVAADATKRYREVPGGMRDVTRHVMFVRPSYFIVVDNVEAERQHQYTSVLHFGGQVSVEDDVIWSESGGGQALSIMVASPRPFKTVTGDDGRPYVHVQTAAPVKSVRFMNVLYPTKVTARDSRPRLNAVDDSGQFASLRIEAGGTHQKDDFLLRYRSGVEAGSVGGYVYDGRVAVVRRGQDGELVRLFMYGGTFLEDRTAGKVLVRGLRRDTELQVDYSGETVSIYGQIATTLRLHAPGATKVFVNDSPASFRRVGDDIILEPKETGIPSLTALDDASAARALDAAPALE